MYSTPTVDDVCTMDIKKTARTIRQGAPELKTHVHDKFYTLMSVPTTRDGFKNRRRRIILLKQRAV